MRKKATKFTLYIKDEMDWNKRKEQESERILNSFSRLIKMHVQKFNPQRFGLDPEDIGQEIKIKIWKILHNEKEIQNYPSYIKKVVNSSVIDLLRKWKREETMLSAEKRKKVSETKNGYSDCAGNDDYLKESVVEAVNSLIESRRKVVRLYLLGMTIEEISAFYGWSRSKTRNLLYRGLTNIKKRLKKKDIHASLTVHGREFL